MMEIRIYFEGHKGLRPGFEQLFASLREHAREQRSKIEFIAAKDGPSGYRKAARSHPKSWIILLKDSEEAMPFDAAVLCQKLGIDRSKVKDVFWMVQCMESWFLADPDAVEKYYHHSAFLKSALGGTENVESIPKLEVEDRLKEATRRTSKGEYNKVTHAPELLRQLRPDLVKRRAENCRKLFDSVTSRLNQMSGE